MNWPAELSELAAALSKMGQQHRRKAADTEGGALREDLAMLDLTCDRCIAFFDARWPRLGVSTVYAEMMWRN